jgi:hypothetical protein
MRLTDVKSKAVKPKATMFRLADGGGLYLEVTPPGELRKAE